MAPLPRWPYPRLCAHRGAGKLAPENTLAALRLGLSYGYRMAEVDVRLSADGIGFLLHDATLDRTTNGRGRADALTFGNLALLDAGSWHSAAFAGEPVASLTNVARWCIGSSVALNIEIKPTPGRERETGAAIALDAQNLWDGVELKPLLSSFSEAALDAARDAVPDLPRALLLEELSSDWLERATALECIALDLRHTLVTAALVEQVNRAGLRIATWTVNELQRVAELLAWGVDTIITDAVDVVVVR